MEDVWRRKQKERSIRDIPVVSNRNHWCMRVTYIVKGECILFMSSPTRYVIGG